MGRCSPPLPKTINLRVETSESCFGISILTPFLLKCQASFPNIRSLTLWVLSTKSQTRSTVKPTSVKRFMMPKRREYAIISEAMAKAVNLSRTTLRNTDKTLSPHVYGLEAQCFSFGRKNRPLGKDQTVKKRFDFWSEI